MTAVTAIVKSNIENSSRLYKILWVAANDVVYFSFLTQYQQVKQLEGGETGSMIMGVMVESNLVEGRQDIPAAGPVGLKYGQSVTDACISWESTVPALNLLRKGVQGRRSAVRRVARGLSLDSKDE